MMRLLNDLIDSSVFIHDDSGPNVRYDQYSVNTLIIGAKVAVVDTVEGFGPQWISYLSALGVFPSEVITPRYHARPVLENLLHDEPALGRVREHSRSKGLTSLSVFFPNPLYDELLPRLAVEELRQFPSNKAAERFNDKVLMRKMAEEAHIPISPGIVANSHEDIRRFRESHPVVILKHPKKSGGRGNLVVKSGDRDLVEVEFPVLVEEYLSSEASPNCQWIIWKGQKRQLFVLDQLLDGCTHKGNTYPSVLHPRVLGTVSDYSGRMADQLTGYEGIVGFDFVIANNEAYLVDLNARFNSSTYPMIFLVRIGADLEALKVRYHHVAKESRSLSDYLRCRNFIPITPKGGILLFNPLYDFESRKVVSFSSLCVAQSADELSKYEKVVEGL